MLENRDNVDLSAHWSHIYSKTCSEYLKTINDKFKTWKKIMKPKGQFCFEVDVQVESDAPDGLFSGEEENEDDCNQHDLGSILLT